MRNRSVVIPWVVAVVVCVVGVDVLFFRHEFLARLLVNIGIVLLFAALYLRFGRRR